MKPESPKSLGRQRRSPPVHAELVEAVREHIPSGSGDAVFSIDTPIHRSDGRALSKHIESLVKPFGADFYTHAHPDHYLCTGLLVGGGEVPIFATLQLEETLHAVDPSTRPIGNPSTVTGILRSGTSPRNRQRR